MKEIRYTVTAARALHKHTNRAAAIRAKIEQYAEDPRSQAANVKKLQGVDALRLRIGDFRGVFQETETTIDVLDVGPRSGICQ